MRGTSQKIMFYKNLEQNNLIFRKLAWLLVKMYFRLFRIIKKYKVIFFSFWPNSSCLMILLRSCNNVCLRVILSCVILHKTLWIIKAIHLRQTHYQSVKFYINWIHPHTFLFWLLTQHRLKMCIFMERQKGHFHYLKWSAIWFL